MPKSESKWLEQGTQRNRGAELLQSVREMKAGLIGNVTLVDVQGVESGVDNTGVEALAGVGSTESMTPY